MFRCLSNIYMHSILAANTPIQLRMHLNSKYILAAEHTIFFLFFIFFCVSSTEDHKMRKMLSCSIGNILLQNYFVQYIPSKLFWDYGSWSLTSFSLLTEYHVASGWYSIVLQGSIKWIYFMLLLHFTKFQVCSNLLSMLSSVFKCSGWYMEWLNI